MLILKTNKQIEKMKKSCLLVGSILKHLKDITTPGTTTQYLNDLAEEMTLDAGAIPAFKGYKGFPYTICASVDNQVVHGFSNNTALKEGSILSIDFGVVIDGWYGDSALTFGIGKVSKKAELLMTATEEALYCGIKAAKPFCRVGDISYSVQKKAKERGYGVVKDFVGHGIGKNLHEEPQVPNFGAFNDGLILQPRTVIAIEPMLTEGLCETITSNNGWGVKTKDGKLSAHFEHTIVITNSGPEILTKRW